MLLDTPSHVTERRSTTKTWGGDVVVVPRRMKRAPRQLRLILEIFQIRLPVYRNVNLQFCSGFVGQGARVCRCECLAIVPVKALPILTTLCSQPDARTIEGVLFDALVRVGAVSSDNADDPTKVSLGRAARTDAGVHAAGNLVSLKLITQIPGVPDVVAAINTLLPPEIRVWGIVRVQNSFNARTYAAFIQTACSPSPWYRSCDSRKYTYFFPSYLLIPPKPGSGMYETFRRQVVPSSNSSPNAGAFTNHIHSFWVESPPESSRDGDIQRKRRWRAGPEDVQRLREIAKKFEGTRNFHNFTVGREFSDRSTQRHMKNIEVRYLLNVLAGADRAGVRYPTQLSTAAQSGSVLYFMVRVSCFTRYPVVARCGFSTYPLDRSCVCAAKRVAYTLIVLCPTAQDGLCISPMLSHRYTPTDYRRSTLR